MDKKTPAGGGFSSPWLEARGLQAADGELHYSMLIQWSDEDQAYLVRLPDWERAERVLGPVSHGDTYTEALKHGLEALEALIASAHKHHETLPEPQTFAAA